MISNKTEFRIYQIFRLAFVIITIMYFSLMIILALKGLKLHNLPDNIFYSFFVFYFFMIIIMLFTERLQLTYFEFHLNNNEIVIKTYKPNPRSLKSFFNLFGFPKEMNEFKINRSEFTNYKLIIGRFGIRKELKLQKTNNNVVYESSSIQLSLIGQKNYTNLVLAIDRICHKICLN